MLSIHTSNTTSDDLIISDQSNRTDYQDNIVIVDDVAFDQHEYNELDMAHSQYGIQNNNMLCSNLDEHPLSINPFEVRSWCI